MEQSGALPQIEHGGRTSEVAIREEGGSKQAVNTAEQELQDFLREILV